MMSNNPLDLDAPVIGLLTAFAVGFVLDLAYTRWVQHTATGGAVQAAVYSTVIGALGLTGVLLVVEQRENAVPYLLGLGLGSYVGVRSKTA
jgi:hypothetical protein